MGEGERKGEEIKKRKRGEGERREGREKRRGAEKEEALTLHGLNSARGYLQSKVAGRIKTRYTPQLRLGINRGIRKSFEAARILEQVLPGPAQEQSSRFGDHSGDELKSVVENDTPESGEGD